MNGIERDLSREHAPVGSLFSSPGATPDPENLLEPADLKFFEEYGYVCGGRILSETQLVALRSELGQFFKEPQAGSDLWYEYHRNEAESDDSILFHALGAWRLAPGFHDLLWHQAWLSKATQLLGSDVRFWHDQLFCKPALQGGSVAWHQDYSYWTRTKPMAHLTCWIALDDATVDNGCLHYIPGSHRWDLLPITGLAGGMAAIEGVLSPEQKAAFEAAVPIELAAGECVFHHPLTIHGSFANSSTRARRATVINVFADGVKSASDEVLLDGVPVIPSGERMCGQFFPLLSARGADAVT